MPPRRCPWIALGIALAAGVASPPPASAQTPRSVRVVLSVGGSGEVEVVSARLSRESPDDARALRGASMHLETAAGRVATLADPRVRHVDLPGADGVLSGFRATRPTWTVAHLPLGSVGDMVALTPEGRIALTLPDPLPLGPPARPREGEEIVTLRDSGDPANRQDIVFLAEGYQDGDLQAFLADVDRVLDGMAEVEPYRRYLPLVNVHAVFTPSVDAGADHPEADPPTEADTALDCTYGAFDIDRLIDCDPQRVIELAGLAPGEDVRVVLVNDDAYGGSGGADFAVTFTGALLEAVAIHELGHTDALLADEYSYGAPYPGFGIDHVNCSRFSDERPWQGWIDVGSPGVDSFSGCSWTDWFRPTDDGCLMNVLDAGYCVVCREQVVKAIHTHIPSLIEGRSHPSDEEIELTALSEVVLALDIVEPADEPLHVTWRWVEREEEIAAGPGLSELEIGALDLAPGLWRIEALVEDRTDWVLEDPFRLLEDRATFFVDVSETGPTDDDDAGDDDDSGGGDGCRDPGCANGCGGGAAWLPVAGLLGLRRRNYRPRTKSASARKLRDVSTPAMHASRRSSSHRPQSFCIDR